MSLTRIYGRRPVAEAFDAGLEIARIWMLDGGQGREFDDILRKAESNGLTVSRLPRSKLDGLVPDAHHQGIVAEVTLPKPMAVGELLDSVQGISAALLLLDGVQDPHNFGAVIRTAEVFGANGVVTREHRAVGLTPTAIKASAGAALRLPMASCNTDQAIREMKSGDWWVYGFDPAGDITLWEADLSGRVGLVFGAEGEGLSALVKRRCDRLIRIPQFGKLGSLNISVSVGVVLAEWRRQLNNVGRAMAKKGGTRSDSGIE